jgi:hypothetical protein
MSNCEYASDRLVLYLEEELSPDERVSIEAHLAECALCREEVAGLESVRSALADPGLFLPQNDFSESLPQSLAARAQEISRPKFWRRFEPRTFAWGLGLAASLVLGFTLIWTLNRPDQSPDSPTQQVSHGNDAFLKEMQSVYARESTSQYLSGCQDLLLNVIRSEKTCQGAKHDVSLEIAQARGLLQQKRLLDSELRRPEVARAKELCDELESLLVELSTSEKCETSGRLRTLEQFIQREQLLLRINLLQSELS